jgi:hypothetical protein
MFFERTEWGECVLLHFCSLALETSSSPVPDVGIHARPEEAIRDEALGYSNDWMNQRMYRVENSLPEIYWSNRWGSCTHVTYEGDGRSEGDTFANCSVED